MQKFKMTVSHPEIKKIVYGELESTVLWALFNNLLHLAGMEQTDFLDVSDDKMLEYIGKSLDEVGRTPFDPILNQAQLDLTNYIYGFGTHNTIPLEHSIYDVLGIPESKPEIRRAAYFRQVLKPKELSNLFANILTATYTPHLLNDSKFTQKKRKPKKPKPKRRKKSNKTKTVEPKIENESIQHTMTKAMMRQVNESPVLNDEMLSPKDVTVYDLIDLDYDDVGEQLSDLGYETFKKLKGKFPDEVLTVMENHTLKGTPIDVVLDAAKEILSGRE